MKKIILLCAVVVFVNSAIAQLRPVPSIVRTPVTVPLITYLSNAEKLQLITSSSFKTPSNIKLSKKTTLGAGSITMDVNTLNTSWGVLFFEYPTEFGPYYAQFVQLNVPAPEKQGLSFSSRVSGVYLFEVKITVQACPTVFYINNVYPATPVTNTIANYIVGANNTATLYFTVPLAANEEIEITCPNMPYSYSYWNFNNMKITQVNP